MCVEGCDVSCAISASLICRASLCALMYRAISASTRWSLVREKKFIPRIKIKRSRDRRTKTTKMQLCTRRVISASLVISLGYEPGRPLNALILFNLIQK